MNSIGFDDRTWLDHFGNPHSDEMEIGGALSTWTRAHWKSMTIDDPKTYTKPRSAARWFSGYNLSFKTREEFCVPSEEDAFNKGVRDPAEERAGCSVPPKQ
jgi:hypothetical protein